MPRPGRDTQAWRRIRKLAYQRDRDNDARCHICGQPIDYTLKPSSCGEAYEPDHVYNVDDHPELADCIDNVAASHMTCNRSRGKKATLNPLGRTSREW